MANAGGVEFVQHIRRRRLGPARRNSWSFGLAATIVNVMPNGVLQIEGSQEVRVNFEMRELFVSGFVRPADISRQNEITYDKIASARISYGVVARSPTCNNPATASRVADIVLPFLR